MSPSRTSAYYSDSVPQFLATPPDQVLGLVAAANHFSLEPRQRDAWQEEIEILRTALDGIAGTLYLEFDVPRLGSRIDAVIVSGPAIFPLEFKCGETEYSTADYNQAWDYALDLKNFHRASHNAPIFPILIATAASTSDAIWERPHADGVRPPRRSNAADLPRVLKEGLSTATGLNLDHESWGSAPYHPTPTIIEAARALYSKHTVEAISRSEAEGKNLAITSVAVEEIIDRACAERRKTIIFVTGVPGAGKTLVGLNIATRHSDQGADHAVFDYAASPALKAFTKDHHVVEDQRLHLATSMRSFRSEKVSAFVKAVLDCEGDAARELLKEVQVRYPLAVTRDLARAKQWIRSDPRYRSNADVIEPGSDDPEQAAEIEACVQLSDRLRALRPA